MEVSAGRNWRGNDNTGGVDGLEDAVDVEASSDLLDQYWGQSLLSEFLMYAEIVYFCCFESLFSNA
jgi:hypothetical protein